jgi:hypothetical protein
MRAVLGVEAGKPGPVRRSEMFQNMLDLSKPVAPSGTVHDMGPPLMVVTQDVLANVVQSFSELPVRDRIEIGIEVVLPTPYGLVRVDLRSVLHGYVRSVSTKKRGFLGIRNHHPTVDIVWARDDTLRGVGRPTRFGEVE